MKSKIVPLKFALLAVAFVFVPFSPEAATIYWANPDGGSWKTASNWDAGRVPGSGDVANVKEISFFVDPFYTVTIDGDVTVGALQVGPKVTLTVQTNSMLTLLDSTAVEPPETGRRHPINGVLRNEGTVRLLGKNLSGEGRIVNLPAGIVDVQADDSISFSGVIENQGTLRKSRGIGSIFLPSLFNAGLLDVQNGTVRLMTSGEGTKGAIFNTGTNSTLNFDSISGYTISSGASFSGAGTNLLSSGCPLTLNGEFNIPNFVMTGGDLKGTNIISGTWVWTAGAIYGQTTLATNGMLTLEGRTPGGNARVIYGELVNSGIIDIENGQPNLSCSGLFGRGTLVNLPKGLIDVADVTIGGDNNRSVAIYNEGTFRKSKGNGTAIVFPPFFNTGRLEAQAGRVDLASSSALAGGVLNCGLANSTTFGVIELSGNTPLGGTCTIDFLSGYLPASGTKFSILNYPSGTGGAFTNLNLPPIYRWQTEYGTTAFSIIVDGITPITIGQQPRSQDVRLNESATFSVGNISPGPFTYQWLFNGKPIPGSTNAAFTIAATKASDAGNYAVSISNGLAMLTSDPAKLTIVGPPAITAQPANVSAGLGGRAVFSVSATGATLYQWQLNGQDIPGATAPILSLTNLQAASAGLYTVVVANSIDRVSSAPAALSLLSLDIYPGLTIIGPVGRRYQIDYASDANAASWISLTNLVLPVSPYLFHDETVSSRAKRFYRAIPQP